MEGEWGGLRVCLVAEVGTTSTLVLTVWKMRQRECLQLAQVTKLVRITPTAAILLCP
jgi:hypothetical protein